VTTREAAPPRGWALATQGLALVACIAIAGVSAHRFPSSSSHLNAIVAVGYLLYAGTLAANLLQPLRLPHLTAYILVGVVGGPDLLQLMDAHTLETLKPISRLAISLIALAGGLELEFSELRHTVVSLFWTNLFNTVVVTILAGGAFFYLATYLPFARAMSLGALVSVALIWGVLASSRSPSATLAVLAQTRARGTLSRWTLQFVMSSDIVVVVTMTLVLAIVRPYLIEGGEFSWERLTDRAHELLGSISLGVTLGLVLAAYLRLGGKQLLLLLLILGFVATDLLSYVQFDTLLAFLVAGATVRNFTRDCEAFRATVFKMSGVVFVVYFGVAGAHLDIPLLRKVWVVAAAFFVVRIVASVIAARLANRVANESPLVKRWSWAPMVSQAGLTLALAESLTREFPAIGQSLSSLVIATVAMNEVIGPILFKFALDRSGETRQKMPSRSGESEVAA
jgi:Kef-type K+ transport system membrane component KefB